MNLQKKREPSIKHKILNQYFKYYDTFISYNYLNNPKNFLPNHFFNLI